MLDALSQSQDIGIRSPHRVIDDDAALDSDTGIGSDARFGADAHSHDHQIGIIERSVIEHDRLDLVFAEDRLGLRLAVDLDAAPFQFALQQITCSRIELALHQMPHEVEHDDLHAAVGKRRSRFEPQQPATDHHGFGIWPGRRGNHFFNVIEVAEGHHARQVLARDGDDERG